MTPAPETGSTRSDSVRPLLALNAALLAVLAFVTLGPTVGAQPARMRGEYIAVAGGVNGATGSVLYIVDTASQELVALGYDPTEKDVLGVGYRDLRQDALDLARGRVQPGSDTRSNQR